VCHPGGAARKEGSQAREVSRHGWGILPGIESACATGAGGTMSETLEHESAFLTGTSKTE